MRTSQIAYHTYADLPSLISKWLVKNLGVILETDLSFSSHVKAVTKSAYYHLKNIARTRCFVSSQDLFMPLSQAGWIILNVSPPAFQSKPLDRCSSSRTLLPGFWAEPENLSISHQSSGPYTVFVTFRIDFKVLLLIYKSLNSLGPKYIADMLTEYKPNRPLRSLGSSQNTKGSHKTRVWTFSF